MVIPKYLKFVTLWGNVYTAELHFSGLTGTASYPDMQKTQITGFVSENRLQWQFEVRLLLLTCI
jgi:hypothetical protein